MLDTCIFCKIYQANQNIFYETSTLFIIIDINPLSHGHLLIIPKKHSAYLHEMDDIDMEGILPLIKKIAKAFNITKYNVLQNNGHIQSVHHVHFHFVPYNEDGDCLKVDWKVIKTKACYSELMDERKKMLQ